MSRQKSSRTQMIRCDEVPDRMGCEWGENFKVYRL
jgi:hypothetical protein